MNLPFRQCSRRTAFAVLARCTEGTPGGALQHISAGIQILATAYLANTDEMTVPRRGQHLGQRGPGAPLEGATGYLPRCLHDTKLLMNTRFADSMT